MLCDLLYMFAHFNTAADGTARTAGSEGGSHEGAACPSPTYSACDLLLCHSGGSPPPHPGALEALGGALTAAAAAAAGAQQQQPQPPPPQLLGQQGGGGGSSAAGRQVQLPEAMRASLMSVVGGSRLHAPSSAAAASTAATQPEGWGSA